MRSNLLKVLQRIPAGFAGQESLQAIRAGASFASTDASSVLATLQGKKENAMFKSFGMPKLPFAAHMSSLASATEDKKENSLNLAEVPKIPTAMTALPARPRGMASHAGHALSAKETYIEHIAKRHPFHVLPESAWPVLSAWAAGNMCLGMATWFHSVPGSAPLFFGSIAQLVWLATTWWRDCAIEGEMGMHTDVVRKNMVSGMWTFIVSEAVLFVGLLWACIHLGIAPSIHIQMQWPPVGIHAIGWDNRALVMSAVLAASYYSANVAMVAKDPKMVLGALGTTVGLGAMFLYDQFLEYSQAPFTITDSPYGSTFFITTGFHGMHVLIGAAYLAVVTAMYARTKKGGVALQNAVLYWHFVDIVWIAVYGIIYVGQF